MSKYEYEVLASTDLERRLNDQILLTTKTEVASNLKDQLIEAKQEIIQNLKSNQVLSNDDMGSATEENTPNGVAESCEFMRVHGTCGVIMNALLLWVDIHRKMAPENVWKIHALNKFLPDEITEVKVILWRIAGDGIIGSMTKRQGVNKSSSEIIDICLALKALSEEDSLPLFICTRGMVAQTPLYSISAPENDISEISMRLKTMEDSINCILLQRHTDVQSEIDSSEK